MDPGTALAVVSLAVQLAGTVQTINEFLRTIRDTPSELVTLIETMDLMQSNLNQVHYLLEQQFSDSSLAGSPVFILNALKSPFDGADVGELEYTPEKDTTERNARLQQVQITTSLRQLQMTTNEGECRPVSIHEDGLSIIPKSGIQYTQQYEERALAPATSSSAFHITSKERDTIWYRGVFGSVAMREKWISTSTSGSRTVGKPISAKKVLTMTSPFLRRTVELYFGASFASIPRALRVYQIIEYDAPIFDKCRDGDLEGIQNEFANGTISPFVVDQFGRTLLHGAASGTQPEICSLLLRLGLDPDQEDNWGQKALRILGTSEREAHNRACETMRILAQAHKEISSADVSELLKLWAYADQELLKYMLSLGPFRDGLVSTERGQNHYPTLGMALRYYGRHFNTGSVIHEPLGKVFSAKWESVIRRLLRIGVDVHAPVPREDSFQPDAYPCSLNPYGTPLDELFALTTTADEAKNAADAWLHILSTEGIDILTYLDKEKALHATRPMFTCPQRSCNYTPRQLVFSLGEAPSVYADWWIDPECSTFLVRQEFKDMNMLTEEDILPWFGSQYNDDSKWTSVWPINYPRWSDWPYLFSQYYDFTEDHAILKQLREHAQERADRRWHKKARRAARLSGTRAHPSMPGAWLE